MSGKRCVCQGTRRVEGLGYFEHCNLEHGSWTAFSVERCDDCGGICGFPDSNLQLAIDKGTAETKAFLADFMEKNSGPQFAKRSFFDRLKRFKKKSKSALTALEVVLTLLIVICLYLFIIIYD